MREMELRDLEDLIRGCAVLGTGGGGSPSLGMAAIRRALRRGRTVRLVEVGDLSDEALAVSPYVVGSVAPEADVPSTPWETLGLRAVETLERHLGRSFDAIVPIEIGGYNTAVAVCVAAQRDIPLLDADPAGRSVPGVEQTTYFMRGVPIAPMALVSGVGDAAVLLDVADDFRAETIARSLAAVSGGAIGVADHPVRASVLRGAVIEGTITRALGIGSTARLALEAGADPVRAILEAGEGRLLFEGTVASARGKAAGGFTTGEVRIQDTDGIQGRSYLVRYKNEHYAGWLDGDLDVTAPDLICILDARTGAAIPNPDCREGMEVSVIGFEAPPVWRTAAGLNLLGPRAFGIEADYRPLDRTEKETRGAVTG